MDISNNFSFRFNLEDSFGLPKLANLDDLNAVPNGRPRHRSKFEAPVLYLKDLILFPRTIMPLSFSHDSDAYQIAKQASKTRTTVIGCFGNDTEGKEFLPIAVELAIGQMTENKEEGNFVLVQARRRVRLVEFTIQDGLPISKVEALNDRVYFTDETQALVTLAHKSMTEFIELSDMAQEEVSNVIQLTDHPGNLADMIGSTLNLKPEPRLEIFMETNALERLKLAVRYLLRELRILRMEGEIHNQIQSELDNAQREVYLREQINRLQKELNDGKSTDPDIQTMLDLMERTDLPDEVADVAHNEMERLRSMPPLSPESGMLQTYLHWLLEVPWTEMTTDNLDTNHAKVILDSNHHGLDKAKDRILEYLAVRSLRPKRSKQPILCFVGAPGTGKTSLGRSIAQAMERNFIRLSLGGVHDEAEIRGHRRTYLGSLPGRIIQTMKKAKVINPVFMLDEIDKMTADFQGDPAAALLEVLDPEQNHAFADHYLEVPYDLSKVLFITTANMATNIPPALLDRMEVIEFPGYLEEDKLAIARQFLIPNMLTETGMEDENLQFSDQAIKTLIEGYTYEAGVRNLEREIGSVLRKLARRKTEGKQLPTLIEPDLVNELLGPAEFFPLSAEAFDEVGVATAVAWTENGGEIMPIEVLTLPGKGNLQLTGQIGEVMQESAQAALSYLRSKEDLFKIPTGLFEEIDIHIHIPEGAIAKDGPSAGITLATALTSAVLGVPVHHEVALTGEITLRGRVLPVGGTREKVLAAIRAGIKTILLPRRNDKDLVDVPKGMLNDIQVVLIDHMDDVLKHALVSTPVYNRPRKPVQRKKSAPRKKDALRTPKKPVSAGV